ncbi:MAG TPA: serine/threonine-protein kinase, partial [Thermoanaerobaculia bacterium]|nr:serine/threonine-protein kinase [Thermoanaerobaculia bacterium]
MNDEPRRIGPYRLEELLGEGGMGAVYRAWDERLERAVAVKQIRRDRAAELRSRRRFQREARAAAQLSHPAVVHVYDVVSTDDGDWIVMELVEGETLARRLRGGPLPLEETVRIARDVAEGLAAAHGKGIVHRDLKAENVMVTPSGQVKVLDFGIAKQVGEGTAEESLTDVGSVVGTVRAMSPEQALGRTVGPPSDLFSLGTLLYEMTTGSSPFVGKVAAETLSRICSGQQRPARQLDPEVPAELSQLIDWLLAKEPAARPSSAAEVAQRLGRLLAERPSAAADAGASQPATTWAEPLPSVAVGDGASQHETTLAQWPLAATSPHRIRHLLSSPWLASLALVALLALLAGALALRSRVAPAPLYVAVLEPEVAAGANLAGMELVPAAVRAALLRGLVALEGIAPLAPEEVDAADGGPLAVARAVAADEVVTSRLSCVAMSCDLALSRVAAGDGRVLWSDQLEVPIDELAVLARSIAARIQGGFAGHHVRAGLPRPAFTGADYAELLRLRRDFDEQGGDLTAILQGLDALSRRAPRFFEAHALAADVHRLRFFSGRDPADLARARERIAAARALGPGDPEVPRLALAVALVAGDDAEAERALAELERLAPGSSDSLEQRAWLQEGRGKT